MAAGSAEQRRRPGRPRGRSDSRARVLAAAERLLAGRGLDAVGLREIAAAAGIRASSLIHLFHSRDGLIEAVVERAARDLDAALAACGRAEDLAGALTEWAGRHPDRLRILVQAMLAAGGGEESARVDAARRRAMIAIWPLRNAMHGMAGTFGLRRQAELALAFSALALGTATAPLFARAAGVEPGRWQAALEEVLAGRTAASGTPQAKAK